MSADSSLAGARVLVAGASGFVGRRLCPALDEAGYQVVAMTRNPDRYQGTGEAVFGDVHDPGTLDAALAGCRFAIYLVHSLDSPDFERLDAEAASAFGAAAAKAGVERIVYLGGLGDDSDDLSAHLRSRREVERLLGAAGVPVTTLRAGIVIGDQGLSWEMTRQLVERLPVMVTPKWVSTRTQPIALADVVRYLVDVLAVPETAGRAFDVGGDEVLRYSDMIRRVARIEERTVVLLPVPLLTPSLSSHWLGLVTDVDAKAGRSLVDSMVNEVIVRDPALRQLVPFELTSFDDAVRHALADREERRRRTGDTGPTLRASVGKLLRKTPMSLTHKVPRDHEEPLTVRRRRRQVVTGTALAGAGLLGYGLSTKPGSREFYATTLATAAVYTVGGLSSGPLHLGWIQLRDTTVRRPILVPVATGVGAFGFFVGCALVAKRIPLLADAITSVLQYADEGDSRLVLATTMANGVAEEIFFRGAAYAAMGSLEHSPVVQSTALYMVSTVPTRNPSLVLAAGVMGSLFALQRRASGGLQAPVLTHLTWSSLMLYSMPRIFRSNLDQAPAHQAPVPALTLGGERPR